MRQPKPWFRRQTRTWYVQIGKKQFNLGRNRRQAWKKYHQLMGDKCSAEKAVNPRVRSILDHHLEWCEQNRAGATTTKNRFHIRRFASHIDDSLRIRELKPHHVQTWIDKQYRGRSDTYKHTAISVIQGALRWAVDQGRIDHSPLDRMRKPRRTVREFFVAGEKWMLLIDKCRDDGLRDAAIVMLSTGARPQEIRRIEAKHFDPKFSRVVFTMMESKGKRRQRVIYLDVVSRDVVQRLIDRFPTGAIFRNSQGKPWTSDALSARFRRLKETLGMPNLCAYSLRHSYAHWALTNGIDSHVVAKLLGHVDGRMLHTRYGHVDRNVEFMVYSANQIRKPLGE